MARSLPLSGLVLVCLFGVVSAHICMWNPRQRGAMGVDNPGDPSCAHKGPDVCGGVAVEEPSTTLTAGANIFVAFQQNLNHWYDKVPGHLSIDIAVGPNPKASDFMALAVDTGDFNAMDEINMANMTIGGIVPNFNCPHCIVRLTYHSNNPLENDTSTDFHQCADVQIVGSRSTKTFEQIRREQTFIPKTKSRKIKAVNDCCAPPQFETHFKTRSLFAPEVGSGKFSYDSVNKFVFVETPTAKHYVNFSNGYEWNLNLATGVCELYGADQWNDWCYGSTQNEDFVDTEVVEGQQTNVFTNDRADFAWGSNVDTCLPVFRSRGVTQEYTVYSQITLGIASQAIFTPPDACHRSPHWRVVTSGTPQELEAIVRALPKSQLTKRIKALRNKSNTPHKSTHKHA